MHLSEPFVVWKQQVQECLSLLVPEKPGPTEVLYQAVRYSLLGEGKRIRPLLALVVADMLGVDIKKALRTACAIEMVHVYSMIHDDLPSMDNDDYRRGKPTLHKAYPESYAILAGDFLLNRAFEVLAEEKELSAEVRLKLIQTLSKKGGGEGMIGGQIMDLLAESTPTTLETLQELHLKKTGALMRAAIECGAFIGEATKDQIYSLAIIGEKAGLAFQIQDDILDIVDSQKKHGKKISSDLTNQKSTYVSLLGLERAKEAQELLQEEISSLIKQLPYNTERFKTLLNSIFRKSNVN